jgi:hypothetical protein
MADIGLREYFFVMQLILPLVALFTMLLPMIFLTVNAAIFHKIAAIIAVLQRDVTNSGDAARSTYLVYPLQLLPRRL